jgi:hypothetical protein
VRYVLIGGLAAVLHGSSATTNDADICPDPSSDNLERLASALRDLDAQIRTQDEPGGLTFTPDAAFLSKMKMLNLTTRYGDVDITFEPAGAQSYGELARRAVHFDIDGLSIPVAALEDIIRSKEAANRPKDRATLPILRALEDEIAQRDRS